MSKFPLGACTGTERAPSQRGSGLFFALAHGHLIVWPASIGKVMPVT
jgi:hypothetical protein